MGKNFFKKKEFLTNSAKETENLGKNLAKFFLKSKDYNLKPIILSLNSELGGGKTTFIKGFFKGLGVKYLIKSPTFVIMKSYKLQMKSYKLFYHFDCYRILKSKEILELGFKEIISNPKNIVAIEWGGKIKSILPNDYSQIKFKFIDKNKRKIELRL